MSEISETQSKLNKLMNEYEVAVIGENRGRNRSGYSEKADKYYQKRRELKEFVAELEAAQRWIPVSERLPKENAPVLVLTVLGGMFVDFIHGKSVVTGNPDFYELDVEDVTHWMPLPKLPEVQE